MQKTKNSPKEKIKAPPRFHLEIEGERVLRCYLSGAVGVCELSEESIEILLKNGGVKIEGKALILSAYDNNCLEISGNITNVSMKYKSARGRK